MPGTGTVIPDDGLRVRNGPGTDHPILGALSKGEQVTLIDKVGDWWGVNSRFGLGFVHGDFIAVALGDSEGIGETVREERLVTPSLAILNPLDFSGDTEVISSSLQGHHTPYLGSCSCDLDIRGTSTASTPVRFNLAGPEELSLRGVVMEVGLACASRVLSDGGLKVKLAIQKRGPADDWSDTGAWVLYAHLDPVLVAEGEVVAAGEVVGALGPSSGGEYNSPCAQGSHVHIEATRGRCVVNERAAIREGPVMTVDC